MCIERLPGRQNATEAPSAPDKMRRVDAVCTERPAQHAVVSAIWSNVQANEHLANGGRRGNGVRQLFTGVLRLAHALTDESVET